MNALPVVDALPIAVPSAARPASTPRSLFDLVLRYPRHLDGVLLEDTQLLSSIQGLVALSVVGLAVHGVVLGITLQLLGADAGSFFARGTPVLWMPVALVSAFLGALCICLPSFYFYTQLSGLDASFKLVTAQALRAQATTSILLLGAVPFYAAWVLAQVLHIFDNPGLAISVGIALPFVVGLVGVGALYRAFVALAEVLPVTHRRRGNFLRRMVLCWAVVYSTVAPVALYRLADALAGKI